MNNLKKYLTFSSSERKGVLFLCLLIICLMLVHWLSSDKMPQRKMNVAAFHQQVEAYYATEDSIRKSKYTRKDFKKYSNSTPFYSSQAKKSYSKEIKQEVGQNFVIEINTATAEDFQKLKGIGKVFSERIVKYRGYLGGFYEVNQLKEVYGMKPEIIETNKKYLSVDATKIKRTSLNQSEFKTLLKHPYLEYEEVKCIFQQKNKNDTILLSDAENCVADSIKSKIKYYFEP